MTMKLRRIVLLGPPGVGKGTQASKLSNSLDIPHINVGNILRQEVSEKTDIGLMIADQMRVGNLVPEDIVVRIARDKLKTFDEYSGFILDGYPRTIFQAEALQISNVRIDAALLLTASDDTIVKRMEGRRTCVGCGEAYHIKFNPSAVANMCQLCGKSLVQRMDDKPQTVLNRLAIYQAKTEPLISFYKKKNMLYEIDGDQQIGDVFKDLRVILYHM